ncbi:unnamed protein product [Adineta ricciae]|uniref:Uncharacterized protein n=1 Tax=Adineta ricciae TaxID=249248 RepID=A0A814WRK8_ADIRI|nr:unnamed protein product [Adineta ricciae]CAF1308030.1 unnamed protein product [Adineta ricciae]
MNFNKTELTEKPLLEQTTEHNTLYAHSSCHHNCHLNCHLPETLEPGAVIFKGCAAMDSTGLSCMKCGRNRLLKLLKEYDIESLRRNYLTLIRAQDNYVEMSIKAFRGDQKDGIYQNLLS